MFKNLSSNAGKASLIPGWGTEMPHVAGLSPRTATTKPMLQSPHCTTKQKPVHHTKRPCMSQLIPDTARQIDTYEKYIDTKDFFTKVYNDEISFKNKIYKLIKYE